MTTTPGTFDPRYPLDSTGRMASRPSQGIQDHAITAYPAATARHGSLQFRGHASKITELYANVVQMPACQLIHVFAR